MRRERRVRGSKTKRRPRIEVIYDLQDGVCYLCANKMPHPFTEWVHPHERVSLDHVKPKNHNDTTKSCRHIRGNALAAHHICNTRKANRDPYACELLYLEYVNYRLENGLRNLCDSR